MADITVVNKWRGNEGLYCPKCGAQTHVKNSKSNGTTWWRTRRCLACGHQAVSMEVLLSQEEYDDMKHEAKSEAQRARRQA